MKQALIFVIGVAFCPLLSSCIPAAAVAMGGASGYMVKEVYEEEKEEKEDRKKMLELLGDKKQPSQRDGNYIVAAQMALNDFGYNAGPEDGIMGTKTRQAIKLFQEDNKLPITGRLDSETRTTLANY